MYILSPDGRSTLKYYLESLADLRENISWVVYHDIQETEQKAPYTERIKRARINLLYLHKLVVPVENVIKEFLYALDDQEIITEEVGTVLKHWDFSDSEPDETNPPV